MNFLDLAFDEVKVVEQSFSRWGDVITRLGARCNEVLGLAQDPDVVFQPRKKRRRTRSFGIDPMGVTQAATMLSKALGTENLRAYRRLDRAARGPQNVKRFRSDFRY